MQLWLLQLHHWREWRESILITIYINYYHLWQSDWPLFVVYRGSAAFSLLCIIAVCVSAIPPGEASGQSNIPSVAPFWCLRSTEYTCIIYGMYRSYGSHARHWQVYLYGQVRKIKECPGQRFLAFFVSNVVHARHNIAHAARHRCFGSCWIIMFNLRAFQFCCTGAFQPIECGQTQHYPSSSCMVDQRARHVLATM